MHLAPLDPCGNGVQRPRLRLALHRLVFVTVVLAAAVVGFPEESERGAQGCPLVISAGEAGRGGWAVLVTVM